MRFEYINPHIYMPLSELAKLFKKPCDFIYRLTFDNDIPYLPKRDKRTYKYSKHYQAAAISKILNSKPRNHVYRGFAKR